MSTNWKKRKKRRILMKKHNCKTWKEYKIKIKDICWKHYVYEKIKESGSYLKRYTSLVFPSMPYLYNEKHYNEWAKTLPPNMGLPIPFSYLTNN